MTASGLVLATQEPGNVTGHITRVAAVLKRLVLLLVLAFVALSVVLFVWAPFADGQPSHVDAIVVLAGSRTRLPVGLELLRRRVAPVLVVSKDTHDKRRRRLCRRPPDRVLCFAADPYSTRGEAQAVARLAREHGWQSLAIVSSRFHLFRVRLLFRRCTEARLELVPARVTWWTWPLAVGSEWAKLAVAETTRRGC
jgi:uncharacterized SAM-binding protein YcdF (DUF218 family)